MHTARLPLQGSSGLDDAPAQGTLFGAGALLGPSHTLAAASADTDVEPPLPPPAPPQQQPAARAPPAAAPAPPAATAAAAAAVTVSPHLSSDALIVTGLLPFLTCNDVAGALTELAGVAVAECRMLQPGRALLRLEDPRALPRALARLSGATVAGERVRVEQAPIEYGGGEEEEDDDDEVLAIDGVGGGGRGELEAGMGTDSSSNSSSVDEEGDSGGGPQAAPHPAPAATDDSGSDSDDEGGAGGAAAAAAAPAGRSEGASNCAVQ